MSESEGSVSLRKTNFKEDRDREKQKQINNQVELLEVYVEQAPSMTIGERLVWHLQQQQKLLTLPSLPRGSDFQMRAINAKFKDPLSVLNEMYAVTHSYELGQKEGLRDSKQQQYQHLQKLMENNVGQYSKDSNTVFYYDQYKVLILLDFSKSTSNIYAFQSQSYLEKMKESIAIFVQNLIFRLENKYSKARGKANGGAGQSSVYNSAQSSGYRSHRKSSHHQPEEQQQTSDQNQQASPGSSLQQIISQNNAMTRDFDPQIPEDLNEQLSDQSPIREPKKRGLESSTFKAKRPLKDLLDSTAFPLTHQASQREEPDDRQRIDSFNSRGSDLQSEPKAKMNFSDSKRDTFNRRKKESQGTHSSEPACFEPKMYLTIAASGLPPNNQIRFLVHNQKVDASSINEVLTSLESRLQIIEDVLAENYNDDSAAHSDSSRAQQEEYLHNHLLSALQILNLMTSNAKPLLILMTDSTNSLQGRTSKGRLDPLIQKLHEQDTKIITVDLGESNKVANSFGFVNHSEHLKYLAYVSRGVYFDFSQLMKLAGIFNSNFVESLRPRLMSSSFQSKGSRRDQHKFSKLNFKRSKFSHELSWALGATTGGTQKHQQRDVNSSPQQMINYALFNRNVGMQPDLSDNDRFHPYLNSLQKLMYARPCSYSKFLQTSEIQELVSYEERMIFENRIAGALVRKLRKDGDLLVNTSFSVRELMLQNQYVPIFRKERLSDYFVKCRNLNQLCHSRSKMCFQFSKINFAQLPQENGDNSNSKRASRKNSSQEESGGTQGSLYGPQAKKIHYHHWWSSQILILCSLQQVDSKQVHVKYKIVAQEEVIHQLRVDGGQKRPHYQENDLQFIHSQLCHENAKELKHHFKTKLLSDSQEQDANSYDSEAHTTLLEKLNNFISHLKAMDKQHSLFDSLLLSVDKGYEYILKRQLEVPEKHRDANFDSLLQLLTVPQTEPPTIAKDFSSNLQASFSAPVNVIPGKRFTLENESQRIQTESSHTLNSSTSMPSTKGLQQIIDVDEIANGKSPEQRLLDLSRTERRRDGLAQENNRDRFSQISQRPPKNLGSETQTAFDQSSQKSNAAKQPLYKIRSSDQHNFSQSKLSSKVSALKSRQVKSQTSEEDFLESLYKNKSRWQRLGKIALSEWPQLFNYRKLDLLTHSNFKFDEIIHLCSQMENQYNPDYQISKMVHAIMTKLTTFAIENGLYIQIFRESHDEGKQDVQIVKSSSGSGEADKVIRVRKQTQEDSHQRLTSNSKQRRTASKSRSLSKTKSFNKQILKAMISKKESEQLQHYGFCLVRVEWAAANLAVFHFGFYNASFCTIQAFLKNFNLEEGNKERVENIKQVMLNDEPLIQKHSQSFKINDYKFFEKHMSQLLIPEEHEEQFNFQVCEHKKNSRYDSDQSTRDNIQHQSAEEEQAYFSKAKDSGVKAEAQSAKIAGNLPFEEIVSNYTNSEAAGDRYYTPAFLNGRKKFSNSFQQQDSVCYHKQWVWKNENRNTNKDFFEIIIKQRIKEGFYFLNRGCTTGKFLFIKALPAYKTKLSKKGEQTTNKKQSSSFRKLNQLPQDPLQIPQPDTYVLIQYVMYFDKDYEKEHRGQSCFKTEIYMEQESAYFYFLKQPPPSAPNQSAHTSMTSSVVGAYFLHSADPRGSVLNPFLSEASNTLSDLYSSVSEKSLFNELFEYLQSVDSFLFNNVCTYHSIVKNSVQKLINAPEPPLIKAEVCYFRSLNIQSKKQRKKQKLENAIRQKMQLLKEDWNEYLLREYPELKEDIQEQQVGDDSLKQQEAKARLEGGGSASLLNNSGQKNKKHSQNQQNERIMEEACFVIQIEELLENSKLIRVEQFDVPQIIFLRKHESLRDILNKFYDQLLKVVDEFSDYRIQNFSNEKLSDKYAFYAKLVTKQILFLIKIPTKQEFVNSILSNRNTGRMSLEFFRLSKKMIKISSKLSKNRILHFLNPAFLNEQCESKKPLSKSEAPEGEPEVLFEEEDSDDDENINQIDQMFDFILYYETSIRDGNNNSLQFEPNVRTIISNFCHYLKANYEIIFADTVLMCLQDEIEKQQVMFGSDETKQNPSRAFEQDFSRIKPTMTRCRFRMDISFLTLLIHTLTKQGLISSNAQAHVKFKEALDDIFFNLIRRNFQQLDIDSEFFIFKHSLKDKALVRELSTPLSSNTGPEPLNFTLQTQDNLTADSAHYQIDLLGTKDSYSDSEETERKPLKNDGQDITDPQVIYNSCKRLLFKVNLVIQDCQGQKIVDEQLQKISSVFDQYGAQIEDTCAHLVEKVKFMEKEKLIAANNQEAILREMGMLYEQHTTAQDQPQTSQVEAQDIQSSVELYFSFYTIPSYVGLLRDSDLDYLCGEAVKENILVNDDDHEDLIRVAKLMDYLGYGTQPNSQRRLNKEEVELGQLVRQFNKKQLVKSIPYYFKRTHSDLHSYVNKDYNVYFYDEIQRKIIYGILRRTYAMMAQNLLEHALQIRPIDSLNVTLAQKYLGSLLFNQRQLFRVTVMEGLGTGHKLKQATKILKEELETSQILNCLLVSHNGQELYLVKSTTELKNFYLANEMEEGNLIPFSPYDSEQPTNQSMATQQETSTLQSQIENRLTIRTQPEERSGSSNSIAKSSLPHTKVKEPESSQEHSKNFSVPFWLLLQVQESADNGGEIRLNVTFHLPLYKAHSQLNNSIVESEVRRTASLMATRIRVIFLLQQTHENRVMPRNFELNRRAESDPSAQKSDMHGSNNFKTAIQSQTQSRMEIAAKNMSKTNASQNSNSVTSPITNRHQPSLNLRQTPMNEKSGQGSNPSALNNQGQPKMSGITSKFKSRMAKLQNQKGGNTTDDNQSDTNQLLDKTKLGQTQSADIQLPDKNQIGQTWSAETQLSENLDHKAVTRELQKQANRLASQFSPTNQVPKRRDSNPQSEVYKANLMFAHVFNIKHSSVSLEAALRQIDVQAKIYHPVVDKENLYVTMINSKVYLMKIESRQMASTRKGQFYNARSFSNPYIYFDINSVVTNENHQSSQVKDIFNAQSRDQVSNYKYSQIDQSTASAPGLSHNQIIMELYGAYPLSFQQVEPLILNIENILRKLTLNVIADKTLVAGSLSKDDYSYLDQSEHQMLLLFPIHEGIDDKYAFLQFLRQNLSRYLYQVSIKSELTNQTSIHNHSVFEERFKATNSVLSSSYHQLNHLSKQESFGNYPSTQNTFQVANLQQLPSERSAQAVMSTGGVHANGSFAGNEMFTQIIQRQDSISSGEEAAIVGIHAPNLDGNGQQVVVNQRLNPALSKSQNIELLSADKDEFIRIDIREDHTASLSDEQTDPEIMEVERQAMESKINYRHEDFLLLYNYKMPLKKFAKSNPQSMADRQKANMINIQQIFNEALALVSFGVLKQFEDSSVTMKGSCQNLDREQMLTVDRVMSELQHEFELMETATHIDDSTAKLSQILGLKYDYKSSFNGKELHQMAAKTYLPLIYKTTAKPSSDQARREQLTLSNTEFGVPLPSSHKHSWLMIKLNIIGELNEERFIQNLVLNVNQSFNEVLIEHCVRKYFKPMLSLPLMGQSSDLRNYSIHSRGQSLKPEAQALNRRSQIASTFPSFEKTVFSKKIEYLQGLVSQGKSLLTTIVHEFDKLIYGDPNELYLSLIFSMITHYHQEFRALHLRQKTLQDHMKEEYGMAIIIELIEKSSLSSAKEKIVKTVILNVSVQFLPANYGKVYEELKLHLSRTATVLRNLQPRVKLFIGSIAFKKEIFSFDEHHDKERVTVRVFKDPELRLDGLRAEPEKVPDNHTPIKGFSDIISSVQVSPRVLPFEESKLVVKRNFFFVLALFDSKVSYQSFNLEKRAFKLNTNMILNQLTWHSNRQDYFKRIVSQKLGTVYTLKDFYSSNHYVKSQGLDLDSLHSKLGISTSLFESKGSSQNNGLKGYNSMVQTQRFTYEEKIKLIEGKQTYQFINSRAKRSKSRGRNQKTERKEQVSLRECQNVADEYLKQIEVSQDALRFLYKSISCQTANQEKKLGLEEQGQQNQRDKRKKSYLNDPAVMGGMMQARHPMLMKSGQKLPEKKYHEDHQEFDKSRHSKKQLVPFKEFIQNKSILEHLLKNPLKADIELNKILTVSPGINPARIDYILCERERALSKYKQKFNMQQLLSSSSFDERVGSSSQLSDKLLLVNPLYFHGIKVNRLMTGFQKRVQLGQNAVHILSDFKPVDPKKEQQELEKLQQLYKHQEPGTLFYFQAQLKDLVQKLSSKRELGDKTENMASFIHQLLPYSRLLYSNTTMFLFEQQNQLKANNHQSTDDFKLSLDGLDDELSIKPKAKLPHLNTEIVPQTEQPQLSQAFMNELRASFFREYCQFLVSKAGATQSYQIDLGKQDPSLPHSHHPAFSQSMQPIRPTLGRRNVTHQTLHNLANSSTNSIKKLYHQDGLESTSAYNHQTNALKFKPKKTRSKKMSDDYSSLDQALDNDQNDYGADKILEEESNSSMMISQQETSSRQNFYRKRDFDRVLNLTHSASSPDLENTPRYVFKAQEDAIFIYELTYSSGLIRINAYGLFDCLHLLPAQLLISHSLLNSARLQGTRKKKELASEELRLSTKLNTDSFNYDFHTRKIMDMILVTTPYQKGRESAVRLSAKEEVNPTAQISHLVQFYKVPPKYARNYVDTVVLRIDLGYLNKISDLEFMSYFSTKIEQYGLKSYSQKQEPSLKTFHLASPMQPSFTFKEFQTEDKAGMEDRQKNRRTSKHSNSQTPMDASKFIFYKHQLGQPPLTKLETTAQQVIAQMSKMDLEEVKEAVRANAPQNESKGKAASNKSHNNSQIGAGYNSSKNLQKQQSKNQQRKNSVTDLGGSFKKLFLVEMLSEESKQALELELTQMTTQQLQSQGFANVTIQGAAGVSSTLESAFSSNQSTNRLRGTASNLLSAQKLDQLGHQSATVNNFGAVSSGSNSQLLASSGKWNNQSKKVWGMKCKQQEHYVSQINMENQEEDEGAKSATVSTGQASPNLAGVKKTAKDQRTIIDLAFYYICVEDVAGQGSTEIKAHEVKKNTEKYPIRALSIDMFTFISQLEKAFNQCRKDLIKDQLWIKFFDSTKNLQLTDIQIGDMLRFSSSFNLKYVDDRYRDLLKLKSYTTSFCSFLKAMLPKQFFKYDKHTNYSGFNRKENLLVFDPAYQNFLIHLDFNFEEKEVIAYLVRKEEANLEKLNEYSLNDKFTNKNEMAKSQKSPYSNSVAIVLNADEKQLVKKLMNLFVFWHYKNAI